MSSLGEVQRIIGLSLNKIQMGRNQRGGLPLHKNLLVATVLNKARDVYMQETMYMNYRLMACGQLNQEGNEDLDEEDTPEAEDYEEDSESDVEDDCESGSKKDYVAQSIVPCLAAASPTAANQTCELDQRSTEEGVFSSSVSNSDEGFIDESDCDCDKRNFCQDSENRVPFQYCFNCAPFHPSNGRGPTLVSPQASACVLSTPVTQEQEDKLIYDMDSKSTRNQTAHQSPINRKRHISIEETQDAITSILPKKMKECDETDLNDSGFQEDGEVFHPAFRGHTANNGMEVEQITSLVSIFSFGQQLLNSPDNSLASSEGPSGHGKKTKDDEDSDSDSDTSSDSGHSSDDQNNADDKAEDTCSHNLQISDLSKLQNSDLRCSTLLKDSDIEVPPVSVATAGF